jgi:hypothetical protein
MKRSAACGIVLSSLCVAAPTRPEVRDVGIGGLWLYMQMTDVLELKGEPSIRTEQADFITDTLEYDDLIAEFNGTDLLSIRSKTNTHCTFEEICPGDSLGKLVEIYGEPVVIERSYGSRQLFISRYNIRCYFEVEAIDSKISSLLAACQP